MMYELLKLLCFAEEQMENDKALAMATIISTIGSSYRKQGTQMVIADDLSYEGALSGGCVEKEVVRQSQKVFEKGEKVVFAYDGRYKLGCNGIIYIVVEPLEASVIRHLIGKVKEAHEQRTSFRLGIGRDADFSRAGVYFSFGAGKIWICSASIDYSTMEEVEIAAQIQLVIIGGEFDSVILAQLADKVGMQVHLIVRESFGHSVPEPINVEYLSPQALVGALKFDYRTAIIFMTHSLAKDLNYLVEVLKVPSGYLGILGPVARKELILNDLMNYSESLFISCQEKLEELRGPVGISIGARTPEEIGISVLAEIIAVFRQQEGSLSG